MLRSDTTRALVCLTTLALMTNCGGDAESTTPGSPTLTSPSAIPTGAAPTVASNTTANPGATVAAPSATNPAPATGTDGTSATASTVAPATNTVAPATETAGTTAPATTAAPAIGDTGATVPTVATTDVPTATSGSDTGATSSTDPTGTTEPAATDTATEPAPDLDQNGKANAAPGNSSDTAQDYLRLGEIRILNNNWGSEDLGCMAPTSTMSVFVDPDQSFGWNFNRGDCAPPTDSSHPDFPQLEFGIHPFGIGSSLETSPGFSSTTLLPIQIGQLTSASVTLDGFNIALQNQSSWNTAMEFWLSERNPVTDPNPGVYAELMTWWGWNGNRWPCDTNDDGIVDYGDRIPAGDLEYTVCHQRDNWGEGWRYYQLRAGDGSDGSSRTGFNGKVDVKALIDYLVNQRGYPTTLWLTRIEVGSEIDDNTSGKVSMRGVTFEVNGQSRSQVLGAP